MTSPLPTDILRGQDGSAGFSRAFPTGLPGGRRPARLSRELREARLRSDFSAEGFGYI